MIKYKTPLIFFSLLLSAALSGCLSLAEDITPPPGMEAAPPQSTMQPTGVALSYPDQPPNPNLGIGIYLEKCAPCHGPTGMGDGPDAAILENSVPPIGSATLARKAIPMEWYTIVTQGNMQAFMPPFKSLSDQERWNVVSYLFTLSTSAEEIEQGKSLFLENCAECHGEDGSQGVVDLNDQVFMNTRSAEAISRMITTGHELMPPFEDLSSDEVWAITNYLRSSTIVPLESDTGREISTKSEGELDDTIRDPAVGTANEDISTSDAPTPGFGDVAVNLVNNGDGTLPTDLEIVLRGYDDMTETYTQTLVLNEENTIIFQDIPMTVGRMYFATFEHENTAYGSNIISVEENMSDLDLTIPYYPASQDTSILHVDRMHIFIDFVDDNTLEIFQLYIFSNPSNQIVTPSEAGGSVVNFIIPENASNLYVEDNMNLPYRKTRDGFGIANIYPQAEPYQTVFSYQIPYDGKNMDLSIPISMDANALILMAPANGFKLKSDQLEDAGTRDFEGIPYNMFTSSGLITGESLDLSLSGRMKASSSFLKTIQGSSTNLVIGLAGFGLALILTGVFLWRRTQLQEETGLDDEAYDTFDDASTEDLMDAIIALDDQYKIGGLPEDAYQQRRAKLKERLRHLVES